MNNKPSIEQFTDADFTIIEPGFIGGDPAITVENAIAPEPFYYELDVTDWEQLRQEALCETEDEEFVAQANEIEVQLADQYGINL